MGLNKYLPILGLEKINIKNFWTNKFNHPRILVPLEKLTLIITQTNRRTKNNCKKSKNNKKYKKKSSSK